MSKKEKYIIKAHINTLRAMMIIFITAIFGVFGYIIVNVDGGFSMLQMTLGIMALCVLFGGLALIVAIYAKLLKQMEKRK